MYIIDDVCYAGEKTQNIKIKEAKVLRGGMLLLTFSTGEQRLFDTTLLKDSAFSPLKDEKVLEDFNIFHGIISFESEFLRRLYQKNLHQAGEFIKR